MKYEPIPEFGQLVEYVTQAEPTLIDGEMVAGVFGWNDLGVCP